MPRPCSICSHPERKAIDKALLEAAPNRRIAATYGVAETSLRRHRNEHLSRAVEKAHAKRQTSLGESLLDKIDRLEHRLEIVYGDSVELLGKAKESGDTTAGVRAVHAVRNVLSESRQQIELLAELKGEIDRRPQVSLQVLAPLLIQALGPCPIEVRVEVARRLTELDKTLAIDADGAVNG